MHFSCNRLLIGYSPELLDPMASSRYSLKSLPAVAIKEMSMQPRYVVVPAIPVATEAVREGDRYYSKTVSSGFNLYDNQEKQRLVPPYSTRQEAEIECERLNLERLQSIQSAYA